MAVPASSYLKGRNQSGVTAAREPEGRHRLKRAEGGLRDEEDGAGGAPIASALVQRVHDIVNC